MTESVATMLETDAGIESAQVLYEGWGKFLLLRIRKPNGQLDTRKNLARSRIS